MTYRNFSLLGEDLFAGWARLSPFRANRLISALEDFIQSGAGTQVAPAISSSAPPPDVAVYLAPPRAVLRGVPDMAALVRVDRTQRIVRIVGIIDEYGGVDDQQWLNIVAQAEQWL